LETIEEIQHEYIIWKYDTYPGFQRVYRIIKRKDLADLDNLEAK